MTGVSSRTATPALTSCGTSASIAGTLARITSMSGSFAGDGVDGHAGRLAGDLTGGRGVADAQPVIDRPALVGQLAQRAGEDHPAGRDDGDLGAQRLQVVHLVAGQQHGGAVGREPAQHLVHVLAARRVQAVGRLVEDQQPRPDQQRGGESDPLPHAEGEAAHLVVRDIRQSDLRQGVVDLRLARRSRAAGPVRRGCAARSARGRRRGRRRSPRRHRAPAALARRAGRAPQGCPCRRWPGPAGCRAAWSCPRRSARPGRGSALPRHRGQRHRAL